jgi:hypothetical protein
MNTQGPATAGRLTRLTKGALTLAAGTVLGLSSFAASAVETTFIGYTNGCFSLSCPPPSTSALQTATIGGLTYRNSNFDVTTFFGVASVGDVVGFPNVDNLGSFTLLGTPAIYTGETFQLRVTFTAPPGTVPTNDIWTANLTGGVVSNSNGSLTIDFDNTAQHFAFNGGTFDFYVNDVDLTPGGSIALSGRVRAFVTAVPEPETYALFMAGLAAVGFMTRRRKR